MTRAMRKIETTKKEASALLDIALKVYPDLDGNGINGGRRYKYSPMDSDDYLEQIARAADWLKRVVRSQKITRRLDSYNFKHMAERWAGDYICNGALIAAAIGLGFRHDRTDGGVLSLCFNIAVKRGRGPDPDNNHYSDMHALMIDK